MAIIGKISVRHVYGDKKKIRTAAEAAKGKPVPVMRVSGIARGFETGEGDNGPWVKFKGQFKAISLDTGEEFKSGKLFLPEVASALLEAQLMDESISSAELAFDINVVSDDSSAVGYIFTADPLIELGENDPLLALDKLLPDLPKLPGANKPKETAKA